MVRKLFPSALILQIARFGFGGLLITVASAAAYWTMAEKAQIDPNLSLLTVFAIFSVGGFFLHSRWSFSGHGDRNAPFLRLGRYAIANIIGLMVNQAFVWLMIKELHGPNWWPIIPMICITPWLTFGLNRNWVFE